MISGFPDALVLCKCHVEVACAFQLVDALLNQEKTFQNEERCRCYKISEPRAIAPIEKKITFNPFDRANMNAIRKVARFFINKRNHFF